MTLKNFLLDIVIFITALIAFEPRLTGISLHEWLSLALGIVLLVHLLWHWDWVINVGIRYFQRLFHLSRFKFVIDLLLLIAFVLVMLSGILISRSLLPLVGIQTNHHSIWTRIHSLASDLTFLLMAVHLGLNWDWIVCVFKRYVWKPLWSGGTTLSNVTKAASEACQQAAEGSLRR